MSPPAAPEGASVAWRALGGVYSITDGVALALEAPHPNAAMLYIDFVLSREGQALYQKLGYASARKDIDNPDKPAKIYYLGDEPDYLQNYEKWTALAHEIFGHEAAADCRWQPRFVRRPAAFPFHKALIVGKLDLW